MLTLKHLAKEYKNTLILEELTNRFDVGVTLVLGVSGAGKSTLLRLCATQEHPTAGEIAWHNTPITKPHASNKNRRAYRQILGYAPQKIDFPEDVTGLDFMLHIGALKGLNYKDTVNQATHLLQRLGLGEAIDKNIGSWSGGMCRRLGLAQAFLGKPQCLVIDEPTAELDSHTASLVNQLIFETAQQCVVIMTTHLQQALQDYQYRTLVIEKQENM